MLINKFQREFWWQSRLNSGVFWNSLISLPANIEGTKKSWHCNFKSWIIFRSDCVGNDYYFQVWNFAAWKLSVNVCHSFNTRHFCLQDLTCIQITCKSLFTQQPGFEIIHVLIRSARITYFHSRSLILIAAGGLLSGAFAWRGKTPISFVISVRLSASISAAYIRGFPWNLIWGDVCENRSRGSRLSQNPKKWHFTWNLSMVCRCWRHAFAIKALLCNARGFYIVDSECSIIHAMHCSVSIVVVLGERATVLRYIYMWTS